MKTVKHELDILLRTGNTAKVFIKRDSGTMQSSTGVIKHNVGVIKGFMVDGDDGRVLPFKVSEVVRLSLLLDIWKKEVWYEQPTKTIQRTIRGS